MLDFKRMKLTTIMGIAFLITSLPVNGWSLSGSDNLGKWRKSPKEERLELSQIMIRKVGEGKISERQIIILSSSVYRCINETAGNGGLDNIGIGETATSCIVLLGNQK